MAAMLKPLLAPPTSDHDFDRLPPYFFLGGDEEDFYPPGPGEDIWKESELLPTPPSSPSRCRPHLDPALSASADRLEALSELLDEENSCLQSFVIQDCMWSSSFAAATELERAVSEQLERLRARQNRSDTCAPAVGRSNPPHRRRLDSDCMLAAECIDPSEVFPYATKADRQSDGAAMNDISLETPPISSSDSESEVDVVTVDQPKTPRRSDSSPLVLKRSHVNTQQHNYAALRPAGKRAAKRRCWSPPSDGEDRDRRRTHNVSERRRRHELKSCFLALRDQVPALVGNHKAAKVAVLKRATEFIRAVREDERRLLKEKDELTKTSRELKRRLEQLRT